MEEEIIAASMDDVRGALAVDTHGKYVVIDTELGPLWDTAKIAKDRVAATIIVLAGDALAPNVREEFAMDEEEVGVTFGFTAEAHERLDSIQAYSAGTIEDSLRAARA